MASCQWTLTSNSADTYVCEHNQVELNFKIQLYCAIIVSCFNSLIARPIDFLFLRLSAPTKEAIETSWALSRASSLSYQQRESIVGAKSRVGAQPAGVKDIPNNELEKDVKDITTLEVYTG